MRTLPLSQGYVALVDDEDFERLSKYKWHALICRRKDGSILQVYATRCFRRGKTVLLQREVMNPSPSQYISPVDGNTLNCQKSNLSVVTREHRGGRGRKRLNTSSQYKGVSWSKRDKVWTASIGPDGVKKHLGSFKNERDAAQAYNEAARQTFGKDAVANDV
jgi:hypothetical protein